MQQFKNGTLRFSYDGEEDSKANVTHATLSADSLALSIEGFSEVNGKFAGSCRLKFDQGSYAGLVTVTYEVGGTSDAEITLKNTPEDELIFTGIWHEINDKEKGEDAYTLDLDLSF